jgi:branched-chain amino acid transport system substrate-binding protein
MSKRWYRGLFLSALLASTASVGARAEIVVGVVTSQTGPIASIGLPYMKGVLAGQTFSGEVNGEKFRLILLDDASDPSNASRAARKLIEEEHVDVMLGSAGSPATNAMIAVATELKTPLIAIAPIGTAPKVDGKAWAVCSVQPASDMVGIVVDYIAKSKAKNVGYIGFSDAFGDLIYNNLAKAAKTDDLSVTSNERYGRTDTSITSQALKIAASRGRSIRRRPSSIPILSAWQAMQRKAPSSAPVRSLSLLNCRTAIRRRRWDLPIVMPTRRPTVRP